VVAEPSNAPRGDDRLLVEAYRRGDLTALDEVFAAHYGRLVQQAERRLGNRHDAEDVVQEAMARALRSLPTIGSTGEFRVGAWLSRIVSNLCHDLGRRSASERRAVDRMASQGRGGDVVEDIAELGTDGQLVQAVRDGLIALPPSQREAFVLRVVEGLEYAELALSTGVSEDNARARVARARTSLRRRMSVVGAANVGGMLLACSAACYDRVSRVVHRGRLPTEGPGMSVGHLAQLSMTVSQVASTPVGQGAVGASAGSGGVVVGLVAAVATLTGGAAVIAPSAFGVASPSSHVLVVSSKVPSPSASTPAATPDPQTTGMTSDNVAPTAMVSSTSTTISSTPGPVRNGVTADTLRGTTARSPTPVVVDLDAWIMQAITGSGVIAGTTTPVSTKGSVVAGGSATTTTSTTTSGSTTPGLPTTPDTATTGTTSPGLTTSGTTTTVGTTAAETTTSETQTPGTQTPGTQTPGTQTPGTQTPGTTTASTAGGVTTPPPTAACPWDDGPVALPPAPASPVVWSVLQTGDVSLPSAGNAPALPSYEGLLQPAQTVLSPEPVVVAAEACFAPDSSALVFNLTVKGVEGRGTAALVSSTTFGDETDYLYRGTFSPTSGQVLPSNTTPTFVGQVDVNSGAGTISLALAFYAGSPVVTTGSAPGGS
jgi:RNA polymerase sigma factor (sigma-70 family)